AQHLAIASASDSSLAIDVDGARVTFTPAGDGGFAATFAPSAKIAAFLRISPDADAREAFYGLGEWPDSVDHRGKLRPMQMELDPASESSDDENHVPVPLVIGTTGWGLFVASRRPGAFA